MGAWEQDSRAHVAMDEAERFLRRTMRDQEGARTRGSVKEPTMMLRMARRASSSVNQRLTRSRSRSSPPSNKGKATYHLVLDSK